MIDRIHRVTGSRPNNTTARRTEDNMLEKNYDRISPINDTLLAVKFLSEKLDCSEGTIKCHVPGLNE